ncbi:hypothetical protein PR048_027755 [Dryococelus australis]|uniref:Secreted protein n=1 Tax=Dryococelus australis TaxID=614101 RepID=A0ABQ9GHD9_9NEOP|nr:hypothetical protein PR048_027755 [Dryococelus australis]
MNSVVALLATLFVGKTFAEKIKIKTQYFNKKIYDETLWICRCAVRNALFCFPYVLFHGEPSSSTKGIKN